MNRLCQRYPRPGCGVGQLIARTWMRSVCATCTPPLLPVTWTPELFMLLCTVLLLCAIHQVLVDPCESSCGDCLY